MQEIEACNFIGKKGLKKVYHRFKVMCIRQVNQINKGDVVEVSSVRSTQDGRIVYEINGEYFYHRNFILFYYKFRKKRPTIIIKRSENENITHSIFHKLTLKIVKLSPPPLIL